MCTAQSHRTPSPVRADIISSNRNFCGKPAISIPKRFLQSPGCPSWPVSGYCAASTCALNTAVLPLPLAFSGVGACTVAGSRDAPEAGDTVVNNGGAGTERLGSGLS